jgi:hypothetical protein
MTYIAVDDEGGWNCDITRDIKTRETPIFEPFTLVVKAYPTSNFGEGPEYAEISVTPDFIEHLLKLSKLCEDHGLQSVTTSDAVDRWDMDHELRITGDSMRVWDGTFWFEAWPKHADYHVETLAIEIASLASVAALSSEGAGFRRIGDKVFYADSDEDLNDLITLYKGDSGTCGQCGEQAEKIIGCPDGAEICQACFDGGQH